MHLYVLTPLLVLTLTSIDITGPIPKGDDLPITVVAQVHESPPDATVYITLTTTDTSTKDEILCVDITVDIGKLALVQEER